MAKARSGSVTYDARRKRWLARFDPVDPETGKQRTYKRWRLTKNEAEAARRELIRDYEKRPAALTSETITFERLAEEFKLRRLVAARYVGDRKIAGRRELSAPTTWFNRAKEYFGSRRLSRITHADIERYKIHLAELPSRTSGGQRSIAALNRELEFLRTVLNFAIENHWLERNPFNASKGRALIERGAETKRDRFPTFGEELALLQVCVGEGPRGREHLRHVLIVAADTGLRRGELVTLEPGDLDFQKGLISLRARNAKTNRARQVPMTRRARHSLAWLVSQHEGGPLFGVINVKRSFATACRLAGVEGLHLHDFRHAFVTRAILAGIPLAVVLKASGHQSEEWKRYLNVTPDQLRGLLAPRPTQSREEVKTFALDVMRQLRDALGYTELEKLFDA